MMRLHMWILIILVAGVLAGGQIWLSHLRYEISLESQRLQGEQESIRLELSKFGLEVASLMNPDRLRRYATETLGMAAPRPVQVVHP